MTPQTPGLARAFGVAACGALLAACSSGPSESEFAAACLQEGQRETFCQCTAKEAKAVVSADGYRWMMLDMQGNRQEAAALEAKMSESDRMDVMKAAMNVLGKCAAVR